jgi:hypothetical protein
MDKDIKEGSRNCITLTATWALRMSRRKTTSPGWTTLSGSCTRRLYSFRATSFNLAEQGVVKEIVAEGARRACQIFCVIGKVSSERNPFFAKLNGSPDSAPGPNA